MAVLSYLSIFSFLAAQTWAQSNNTSPPLSMRFSPSSSSNQCSNSNSIGILLVDAPTQRVCLTLSALFQNMSTPQTLPTGVSLQSVDAYNSMANYSQVLYVQNTADANSSDPHGLGQFHVESFNADGCVQRNNQNEGNTTIPAYSTWNCMESGPGGACSLLDYGVRSVSVRPVDDTDRMGSQCLVAAAYGKESGAGKVGVNLVFGVCVLLVVMMML